MEVREFTRKEYGTTFSGVAYTKDGGKTWQWQSNDAYCPLDACKAYNIPCDVVLQEQARSKQLHEFLERYRQQQAKVEPSAEEQYEMRAAFGPGATITNILTGRKYTT